jgi:hypothetical protein
MCLTDVSDDPDGIFAITAPSFDEIPEFALSVAVVDARRVLRARETTATGV